MAMAMDMAMAVAMAMAMAMAMAIAMAMVSWPRAETLCTEVPNQSKWPTGSTQPGGVQIDPAMRGGAWQTLVGQHIREP